MVIQFNIYSCDTQQVRRVKKRLLTSHLEMSCRAVDETWNGLYQVSRSPKYSQNPPLHFNWHYQQALIKLSTYMFEAGQSEVQSISGRGRGRPELPHNPNKREHQLLKELQSRETGLWGHLSLQDSSEPLPKT